MVAGRVLQPVTRTQGESPREHHSCPSGRALNAKGCVWGARGCVQAPGVFSVKIYVGNLSYETTDETLRDLFSQHGEVEEVAVIADRDTGRSRGFAFVTMPDAQQAQAAIAALNGMDFEGRSLNVNEARQKSAGGGGGGAGGGGGRGGGRRERPSRW